MTTQTTVTEPAPDTQTSIEATKQALVTILVRLAQEQPQSVQSTKAA
jgi:hypothetical protein